jgi:cytochrome c-type biogenesis protein CcmH/NrfG
MGRLEEAASAFESALELCPDYPEASRGLADVRRAMERRDDHK